MRKRIFAIIVVLLMCISLTSCDLTLEGLFKPAGSNAMDDFVNKNGSTTSVTESAVSSIGITNIGTNPTSIQNSIGSSSSIESIESTYVDNGIKLNRYTFSDKLSVNGPLTQNKLPSDGRPKMLVIPVNMVDDTSNNANLLQEIRAAFLGTAADTGWMSLKEFYYTSSYGKLRFDITVMDGWFSPKYRNAYYEGKGSQGAAEIFEEVMDYYDKKIDFSKYDSDGDGYIDAIWLVYNAPVDFDKADDLYWAYVYSGKKYVYDNTIVNQFAFGGTDFMHINRGSYDRRNIKVDSHVFVHETGHLMGLDDYYDYNTSRGKDGGMYTLDMMDSNCCDHGMISKLLLGWISPIIPSGSGSFVYDLNPFSSTGDCLVLANHELTTIYDEYFMIEYFDGKGLNSGVIYLDKPNGIRIVHVDARKNTVNGKVELNGGTYRTGYVCDNTDTNGLFCDALKANVNSTSQYFTDDCFYVPGGVIFGKDVYSNYVMHDDTNVFFTLEVLAYNSDGTIKIKITM